MMEVFYCLTLLLGGHVSNIGKGRGRQVIAVARTADLILMMLDAVKGDVQRWEFLISYCILLLVRGAR